jgi:hypothetical protein
VEKEPKTDAELEDMILQRMLIGGVYVSVHKDPHSRLAANSHNRAEAYEEHARARRSDRRRTAEEIHAEGLSLSLGAVMILDRCLSVSLSLPIKTLNRSGPRHTAHSDFSGSTSIARGSSSHG